MKTAARGATRSKEPDGLTGYARRDQYGLHGDSSGWIPQEERPDNRFSGHIAWFDELGMCPFQARIHSSDCRACRRRMTAQRSRSRLAYEAANSIPKSARPPRQIVTVAAEALGVASSDLREKVRGSWQWRVDSAI